MEDSNVTDEKLQMEEDVSLHEDMIDEGACNEEGVEMNLENNELLKAPQPEMAFNSLDELVEYYKQYGKQEGFGIRKNSSCFLADMKSRCVTLSCSRAGKSHSVKKNQLMPNPSTKTECKARVCATVSENGKCRVNSVKLEHNHGLNPRNSSFYLSNREMNKSVQRQLEISDQARISVTKNYNHFAVSTGGYENVPFLEKDSWNYVEKSRRLRLGVGDADAMFDYFGRMQGRHSNFYYLTKMDEDSRLKHVFWADGRSRAAYEEFGDVVAFDTTYLTNKYNLPLAVFVGVNHHGQLILLGCGLISNEDTDAFVWLFRAWLSCMSRRAPNAIITDQDKAMKKAIQIVFPNTQHRWCLSHIMKKIPRELCNYSMYLSIIVALHNVVYDSLTKEEFEENWGKFIVQFNLKNNAGLSGLYEERHRWAPAYVKDTFLAGMSTTQRFESMHAFFDGFVNSKTTLKQFVEQYDNALRSKVEKEKEADFRSFGSYIPCVTHYEIEKQFQEIYTHAKFKEFQAEITGKIYCEVSFVKDEAGLWEFDVIEDVFVGEQQKQVNFKVYFNEEECEVECSCQLFEFRGILCRHAISVLIKKKVIHAPSKFILQRWGKDLRRRYMRLKVGYDDSSGNPEARRYAELHKLFIEVSDLAIISDKRCMMLHECFNSFEEKVKKIKTDLGQPSFQPVRAAIIQQPRQVAPFQQ